MEIIPKTVYLPLIGYSVLFIILFFTQHYDSSKDNYPKEKPINSISGLFYSIISIILIILFIDKIPNLSDISYVIGETIFETAPPTNTPAFAEYQNAINVLINFPLILLLTGFLGNYSRAFYTLNELDHGKINLIEFGGYSSKGIKRLDGALRFIIFGLFFVIGNLINGEFVDGEIEFLILRSITIDPMLYMRYLGWLSLLMYSFLIIWACINKQSFKSNKEFNYLFAFFVSAIFIAVWFFSIGYNWAENFGKYYKQIYHGIMCIISIFCATYMLFFIYRDLFYVKRKAILEEKYIHRIKRIFV